MAKTPFYQQDILAICDHQHITVDEIFAKIQKKYPQAGKATIYRNVEELTKQGLLKKIKGVGGKALFERNIGNHIHFIDQETGKIYDIDMEHVSLDIPEQFEVEGFDIRLIGRIQKKGLNT